MTVSRNQIHVALLALAALIGLWLLRELRGDDGVRPVEPSAALEPGPAPANLDVQSLASPGRVAAATLGDPAATETGGSVTQAVTLRLGIRLHGLVLPVEGSREEVLARVQLTDETGEQWSDVSGPQSGYEFLELTSGRYWISAKSGANEEVRRTFELKQEEREHRLDLRLETMQELAVEVSDAFGQPITEGSMAVIATVDRPGEWIDWRERKSIADVARWSETHPGAGRLLLAVPPPLFVSVVRGERVLATQHVEPGRASLRFVLDTAGPLFEDARVRLRLVALGTREPLALSVEIIDGEGMRDQTSGSDGVLEFKAKPGRLRIAVRGGDWQSPDLEVRASPGANDIGDVELEPGVHVSGWIVDENGPAERVWLQHEPQDAPSDTAESFASRRPDLSLPDGSFRISGLSRAVHRLTVNSHRHALQVLEIDTSAGSVENLTVRLASGAPLRINSAGLRTRLQFTLWDERGVRMYTTNLRGTLPQDVRLAPGRYDLDVRIGQGPPERRSILIGGEPVEISIP